MGNFPVQAVINTSDFVEEEKKHGGGHRKDYYADKDNEFRAHKVNFTQQLDQFSTTQQSNPYTKVAYAMVVLDKRAIAKSNRPTHKLLTTDNECKVVGGNRKGEMLVRFSPSSAEKIKETIAGVENEPTKWEMNLRTGKMETKPSMERSELGAIKEVRPFDASDRCQFTADNIIDRINENGCGQLYVELFETQDECDLFDSNEAEEARKMYNSFEAGLEEFPGLRVFHSSLNTAKRCYALYLTQENDTMVRMGETIVSSNVRIESVSEDVDEYEALLEFLSNHPVVKKVMMSPMIQSVPKPSFQFDGTEDAGITAPEGDLEDYPLIGVADTGIADVMDDWVEARVDNLHPKHKDPGHGTFIGGLYIKGHQLNPDFMKERDGNRLVDICVMPSDKKFAEAYPNGIEEFMENLRNCVAEAVDRTHVKVISLSMNIVSSRLSDEYSMLAKELDDIMDTYGVVFVNSAGNLEGFRHKEWVVGDPEANIAEFTSRDDDIVYTPGECIRGLTVGAVNPPDNGGLTSYTCIGKGLATGVKPDLVHVGGFAKRQKGRGYGLFSVSTDGNITTSCGTSFSAPIVAKTVAALNHQIEGDTPTETLLALTIHSGRIPEEMQDKKYREYLENWIGYGIPADSESILNGNAHGITLVFHNYVRQGEVLSFKFGWPPSLIKNGKCLGRLKLTVVCEPQLDYSYEEEFVREDVQVSLCQVKRDEETGKDIRATRLATIYPSKKEEDDTLAMDEIELREGHYKWNPVKVYEKTFPKGVSLDAGTWQFEVRYLERGDVTPAPGGLAYAAVLTIEDPKAEAAVYHEMRQDLQARGVQMCDIQMAVRISPRIG